MKNIFTSFLLLFSLHVFSGTIDSLPFIRYIAKEGNWMNASVCPLSSSNGTLGAYRIESSIFHPIKTKSKIGLKFAYTHQNEFCEIFTIHKGYKLYGIGVGLTYRYNFLAQTSSPFFGIDLILDSWKMKSIAELHSAFDTQWEWGSSYFINLGYSFSAPKKNIGFETSYSIGLIYANNGTISGGSNNYTYNFKNYFIKYVNFIRVGINYYF